WTPPSSRAAACWLADGCSTQPRHRPILRARHGRSARTPSQQSARGWVGNWPGAASGWRSWSWLTALRGARSRLPATSTTVPSPSMTRSLARLGRELARRSERVAFLVMADGSARRTLKAPGYLDDRAEPFDDEIARALAAVDTKSLAAIDPTAASDLLAAGRAPWQVL